MSADQHVHAVSYAHGISTAPAGDTYAIERGTCECGELIHRPIPYGTTPAQCRTRATLVSEELDHRTERGTAYRLTAEDEQAVRTRILSTLSGWISAGSRWSAGLATERDALTRIGANALFCSTADLRDCELEWITARVRHILADQLPHIAQRQGGRS